MINIVWDRIVLHEGEIFTQIKGKEFTYRVVRETLIPSTTNVVIRKNDIENALCFCPLRNTMPLQLTFRGPSYIYSLLTDQRIIEGLNLSESIHISPLGMKLEKIFDKSIESFFINAKTNIINNVSERNLCVELRDALNNYFYNNSFSKGYYIDNEYNRNAAHPRMIKTIIDNDCKEINITCDIIIHSRGENIEKDNLLAIEMKKNTAPQREKDADKYRLRALTKKSYDDIWCFDGVSLPKHVCGYELGIYFEINSHSETAYIEYFHKGKFVKSKIVCFGVQYEG